MTELIHTGDTHLGYRQYHHPEREQDYFDAFSQVVDIAIDQEVDAVVHAGDFFHDSRPTTKTIRAALDELSRLQGADIPFLGVVGNHDETQNEQWIDIFSGLDLATHLSEEPVRIGETALYGIDHLPHRQREQREFRFEPSETQYNMIVVHALVDEVSPHGEWEITPILRESDIEFDAVLLGDDHEPRLRRLENTVYTYAGSTERTATDQRSSRGCNLIQTYDGEISVDRLELDTRPHVFLDIELKKGEGEGRIREEIDEVDVREAILAITISGDGAEITPAEIEEYARRHGSFIVRISDRREFDFEEGDIDVSFADPDSAIQEQLEEKMISKAAYEIEQMVRDTSGVALSNLSGRIESRVAEQIEEDTSWITDEGQVSETASDDSHKRPQDESVGTQDSTGESSETGSQTGQVSIDDF